MDGGSDYPNTKIFLALYGHHMGGSGQIVVEYRENNEIYHSHLGVNRKQVEYIVQKQRTIIKDEVLATQSYVTNQIQGAINASY